MKKNGHAFLRRLRGSAFSAGALALFIAALIVLNAAFLTLEKRRGWRVDYSFNALTTTTEATMQVLSELPCPVHIYALYSRGQEDQPLLELLDRYAAASPLVTWEQADIAANPGLLARFTGSTSEDVPGNDSLIVSCEETGRWRVLDYTDFLSLSLDVEQGGYRLAGLSYESEITSALRYVTQAEIPRIVVLQGHGELDEAGTGVFAELMRANNYEVVYAALRDAELQPDDLLALLSPVRDLTDDELAQITEFTAQGGSLLVTCDYSDPTDSMPNYAALLRAYGFVPLTGIVVASQEEPDTYYNDNRVCLIPSMLATDITADLTASGADVLLLTGSRAFRTPEEMDQGLTVLPMLMSGSRAYLRDLAENPDTLEEQDGDPLGPFALALQASRVTQAGYVSRAVALGCSTLLTSTQVHAMTDSEEFIIRTAEYLLDAEPADLGIMARTAVRPQLAPTSVTLGSVLLAALPLGILAAALIVLLPRRHL